MEIRIFVDQNGQTKTHKQNPGYHMLCIAKVKNTFLFLFFNVRRKAKEQVLITRKLREMQISVSQIMFCWNRLHLSFYKQSMVAFHSFFLFG